MAERIALVDAEGRVVNVVVAPPGWQHPEFQVVPDPDGRAAIGGVWDGHTFSPPPATPAPAPPLRVSALQARLALHRAGLLEALETLMQSPDTPREAKIAYEYATEWHSDDPLIAFFASQLGLSDEDVAALFAAAKEAAP